jgi:hypothetical protein
MSAKSKGIPIPRPSPQARELSFEELRGGLVVIDWDLDVPVAKLPLEVSAAIWSGRKTICPNRNWEQARSVVTSRSIQPTDMGNDASVMLSFRTRKKGLCKPHNQNQSTPVVEGFRTLWGGIVLPEEMLLHGRPYFGLVQPLVGNKLYRKPLKWTLLDRQ